MSLPPILAVVEDRILTLTLNRPEQRNALDEESFATLVEQLGRAEHDPAIRAVVLAAAGRHFSAGADLTKLKALTEDTSGRSLAQKRLAIDAARRLALLEKPTLAVVQGGAHGAGIGLILCCDIAIAEEGAHFALGEVRFGLFPGPTAALLARAIGSRQAARLLLTGRRFDAHEALRLGLVHEVVPAVMLSDALAAHLRELRANAPGAMAATKRLLRDTRYIAPPSEWDTDWMAEEVARHRAGTEAREGVRAFLEKRPPNWAEPGS
jgi:methylglutaconyl-CoA hydratase